MIYVYIPAGRMIGFVDVYDKDEAENLTRDGKRVLATIAAKLQECYRKPR